MLDYLPDEIIRMIINKLPEDKLVYTNLTCQSIYRLKLSSLLLGWYLESTLPINYTSSRQQIIRGNIIDRKKGPLYCMYDMIYNLSKLIGDVCIWDKWDVIQKDILYRLLVLAHDKEYLLNMGKQNERKILISRNIPDYYISKIMNSLSLRALLY